MDLDKEELEATRNIGKTGDLTIKNLTFHLCKITKAINASYLLNDNSLPIKGNRDLCDLLEDTIYCLETQDKAMDLLVQQLIFYSEKFDNKFKYENDVKKYFIKKVEG